MAAPVLVDNGYISEHPWLMRKYTVTSGDTITAFTHSGPAVIPDIVFGVPVGGTPGGMDYTVTLKTTTTFSLDFEDDGNDTWDFFAIWFSSAGGGISA